MFEKIFFVILSCVGVSLTLPMEMFVHNVAESDTFDNFDNYIPKYDDIPNYNHPPLNHVKNESLTTFNASVFEIPIVSDNQEVSSLPFTISTEDIPTIELKRNGNDVEDTIKNISDSDDNLSLDFFDTENTTNISVIHITPTYVDVKTNSSEPDIFNLLSTESDFGSTTDENKNNSDITSTITNADTITNESTITDADTISTTTNENKVVNVTPRTPSTFGISHTTVSTTEKNTEKTTTQKEILPTKRTEFSNTFNISDIELPINDTTRNPREEAEKDDPEFADKNKGSQADGSSSEESEEEEDMNMVTGLLSALLGGFSKPDGGIDLDAIVGLVGSLSTQNDDGTYDFQGLTELLKGFFGGGGGDGGGGSDIGAFTGGILGAVIKGIANPPGGKGVGILTAKILGGILPALSVQPPEDGKPSLVKPGGLDLGGFLGGFIKTLFGSSKDINPVKFLISTITSLSNSKPTQPKGKN